MDAPATPPNAPKIRVNRESSNGAWHAGHVISYDCVSASVHGIRTKHKGHFRFHMKVPTSAIPLSLQIGEHGLRGSPAAGHRAVHRGVVAMVAASIDTRTDPDRALRRLKRSRILLRLRMCDAVTSQHLPGAGRFAKEVLHLSDDEAAQLRVGQLLNAQNGNRNQMLAGGGIPGSNARHQPKTIDLSSPNAV